MTLHEAVKKIIKRNGKGIVTEVRLANILADTNAFEQYPAMSTVMRACLKKEAGRRLLDMLSDPAHDLNLRTEEVVWDLVEETGCQAEFVRYALHCILYGLGAISDVAEPKANGFNPYGDGNGNGGDALAAQLASYKTMYVEMLERLVTIPKDVLRDGPAYYSADAEQRLGAMESKISALMQKVGETGNWCEQERAKAQKKFGKKASAKLGRYEKQQKSKYTALLRTRITIPKKYIIKRSGYYTAEALEALRPIEENIRKVYALRQKTYDNWCEEKMRTSLAKHSVGKGNFYMQVALKIVVPILLLVVFIDQSVRYALSLDDVLAYEETMEQGEKLYRAGDYDAALEMFTRAKRNYDGCFWPSYFASDADAHIANATRKAERAEEERKKKAEWEAYLDSLRAATMAEREEKATSAGPEVTESDSSEAEPQTGKSTYGTYRSYYEKVKKKAKKQLEKGKKVWKAAKEEYEKQTNAAADE